MAKKKAAKKTGRKGAKQEQPEEVLSELEQARRAIATDRPDLAGYSRTGNQAPHIIQLASGVFPIDYAMLGGYPDGGATLIYGVEGSGKTTMGLRGLIAAQRKYPESTVVLLDFEHMFDPIFFMLLGGDLARLELIQPPSGEAGIDLVKPFLFAREVSAVMVDTIAAIIPFKMVDRSAEDYGQGERARLAGLLCTHILSAWGKGKARGHSLSVFFLNQYRDDLGKRMGVTRKLPGGWQPNYLPKTRFQMKCKKKFIGQGDDEGGGGVPDYNLHTFTFTKDKGMAISSGEFRINLNPAHPRVGVHEPDHFAFVGALAKKKGYITGGGGHWRFDGQVFSKLENIEQHWVDNPDAFLRIQRALIAEVRTGLGMPGVPDDNYLLGWV